MFPLRLQCIKKWQWCRMCFVCSAILAAINSNIRAAGYPTHRRFSHELSISIDLEAAILHKDHSPDIRTRESSVLPCAGKPRSDVFDSSAITIMIIMVIQLNYKSVKWSASWSSGQSFWLLITRSRFRFLSLPWGFSLWGKDPRGDHGLGS